jgi:hypothetical protein
LWLPLLFTGCAGAPPPISTFQTDSSEVSIFGLDESTDLEALISTTGLDPSVTETLSRLRGQQIAVVNLRTQPQQTVTGPATENALTGEPGLHLSWQTTLVPSESGATYAYPLGTGAAWAHPIEMTRVYVLVPEDLGFTVIYPKLGTNRSGYVKNGLSYEPRIAVEQNWLLVGHFCLNRATRSSIAEFAFCCRKASSLLGCSPESLVPFLMLFPSDFAVLCGGIEAHVT